MEGDYLWHGADGRDEVVGALARMPLDLDADKYRHAQTNSIAAEQGAIALDDPFLFQALYTPQARGRRQADFPGEFDIGEARVGLKLGDDAMVQRIKWYILACSYSSGIQTDYSLRFGSPI